MAKIQSVEPNIADLANGWLKSYKLDYKLEQEIQYLLGKILLQCFIKRNHILREIK